jgi:tetratricopeptide (TPR) repeat protein
MKSVTKKQIAVLAGSLIIVVLLLVANTKLPDNKEDVKTSEHAGPMAAGMSSLVENATKALSTTQKTAVQKLEAATETATDKKAAYERLISTWDSLRQPAVAAYYMEKAALASPVEKNWTEAGNRYYMAIRFVGEAEHQLLYSKAIACFEKALELNPSAIETRISLASCYVEGSADPMKGIGMLKEVEKIDSNNVNLQLNFAFFSEKSGQWDKAIKRFEKVLKIQPDFIEAYLHLADAYKQKGDTPNAIKSLEKYLTLTDDVTIKTEVQNYINQLKNS